MTVLCACKWRKFCNWFLAASAAGFVTAEMLSAMSTSLLSSERRWCFRTSLPSWPIAFKITGGNKWMESPISANSLMQLSRQAALAVMVSDCFPVMILPVGSCKATTGTFASASFSRAAFTTGRSCGESPLSSMMYLPR